MFDLRLTKLAYDDERAKLLLTIPGVSFVLGQALVAAFGDITRLKAGDSAASWFIGGLGPSKVLGSPQDSFRVFCAMNILFQATDPT